MADDPCIEAAELKKIYRDISAGVAVSEIRHDDKSVSYTKADLPRLKSLIEEAERQCAIVEGRTAKRTRYAMGARFRPY